MYNLITVLVQLWILCFSNLINWCTCKIPCILGFIKKIFNCIWFNALPVKFCNNDIKFNWIDQPEAGIGNEQWKVTTDNWDH